MANASEPGGLTAVVPTPSGHTPLGHTMQQPAVRAWLRGRCLQSALTGDAVLRCEVCAAVFDRDDGHALPALEADDNGHDVDERDPDDGQLLVNDTPAPEVKAVRDLPQRAHRGPRRIPCRIPRGRGDAALRAHRLRRALPRRRRPTSRRDRGRPVPQGRPGRDRARPTGAARQRPDPIAHRR